MFPIDWYWGQLVSYNKAIEVQLVLGKNVSEWFRLSLETRSRQDHAGLYFTVELLQSFYFHAWLYDTRHWNQWKGRFYKDEEEAEDLRRMESYR
jgi:hypothetical protein